MPSLENRKCSVRSIGSRFKVFCSKSNVHFLFRMHQKLREPQNDCEGVSAETDETIKPQNTSDV